MMMMMIIIILNIDNNSKKKKMKLSQLISAINVIPPLIQIKEGPESNKCCWNSIPASKFSLLLFSLV